jgi:adenylate cyclase class 2
MIFEVELKYRLNEPACWQAALAAAGATFDASFQQLDTYYRHPVRDFARTDEALRLRKNGDDILLTYKGPRLNGRTKTRQEIEVPIGAGAATLAQFAAILLALGFQAVFTVKKHRQPGTLSWQGRKIHLALDHIEGVGHFLELESIADGSSLEAAQVAVASLASHLGLNEVEPRSYLELCLLNSQ